MIVSRLKGSYRLSSLFRTSFSVHIIDKTSRRDVTESKVDLLNNIVEMPESRVKQFYRRELPKACIAFSSQEGKKVFSESLSQGYMECYFKLAEQFRTQDEPAFCGLTTLVMVLNSLSVDPGRVWKGPWRWYHENMLDCCVPLKMIKEEGINFNQMICLACCNGLDVQAHQMSDDDNNEEALHKFRSLVREMTQKEDKLLVLSYSRRVLGQTGDGHFSPVGGYHPERDLVLILDTARFKYPPHWVSLRLIWDAMLAHDKSTGKPRGHMVMSRLDSPTSLVLFRIFPVFSVSLSRHKTGGFSTFISLWRKWLSQSATLSEVLQDMTSEKVTSHSCEGVASAKTCCSKGCKTDVTAETTVPIAKDKDLLQDEFMTEIQKCIMYILQIAENISPGECILTTNVDLKCVQDQSKEHACVLQVLLSELESLPLFKEINEILAKLYFESPAAQQVLNKLGLVSDGLCSTSVKLCKANSQEEACNLAKRLTHSHFLAIFLLSWPYAKGDNSILNALEQEVVLKQNSVLQSECSTLRKQISLLMKLCQDDGHCAE